MAPKHVAQPAKVMECDDDRQCRICWGEEEMSLTRSTVDGMLVAPCSCAGGLHASGVIVSCLLPAPSVHPLYNAHQVHVQGSQRGAEQCWPALKPAVTLSSFDGIH